MRRLIYILPLLLFAVLAGYFALGLTRDPSVVPSALIDKPVPEFDLPPLLKDGQGLASADLKGKVQARQRLRILVRAVPDRASGADAACQGAGRHRQGDQLEGQAGGRRPLAEPGRQSLQRHRRRSRTAGFDRLGRLRRAGNLRDRCPGAHPLQGRRPRHAGRGRKAYPAADQGASG